MPLRLPLTEISNVADGCEQVTTTQKLCQEVDILGVLVKIETDTYRHSITYHMYHSISLMYLTWHHIHVPTSTLPAPERS